jgi:hypothetical protein
MVFNLARAIILPAGGGLSDGNFFSQIIQKQKTNRVSLTFNMTLYQELSMFFLFASFFAVILFFFCFFLFLFFSEKLLIALF